MGHKITVSFSEDGADVTIKVEGMKGRGCLAATLELERALFGRGGGKGRTLTGEASQVAAAVAVAQGGK